ncbi:LysR family transcriptional regulator [Stenotrophomonas sp. B2]|uniref:LysR family transcriptional regulator n=1 Tax=Stenotrophomonas sp. B2 TaxID=1537778 RepID=UPI001875B90E|nr:LysR family transcriptional regulator [Stenotrophomonas sp. B2]MBE5271486.1 LysR family transcriptional regulator [Stenotrophomonas sp. B2]HEL3865853.1 LysR family transcriptional regulator [Stenotrophomonas maltophilia]HEL4290684.1 LysR family transcriptional regulator [Stenotrophomonas maltophilia]
MDTLDAMRVFVAVVERNGFSAAAQALDMSTAGVTRQVAALEKRLSTRLLHRTTRRVSPTSAGAAYYAQCVRLLAEFDALEASIGAQALEPSGLLRINAPVSWGIARLGPLLAGFRERFPQVELDLALSDRLVDMVEEGYDVAIRITREPGPTLIARRLGESRVSLCAAPSYLAAHGTPATPQALQDHACLGYSYWAGGDQWPLHGPGGDVQVTVNSVLRANNGDVLREAAIAGMGVILQPDFLLQEALADGRLVRILPDWEAAPIGIFAVYTSRSHLAPKVRSFIDYLVEARI